VFGRIAIPGEAFQSSNHYLINQGIPVADRKEYGSASGCGLKHSSNFFEDPDHADIGIDGGVNFVMVSPSMHHEDFSAPMRLLDHVGQVMAIFLGHGWAQDYEVKGIALKCILNGSATNGSRHAMADLGHFGCLRGQSLLVGLCVENLDSRALRGDGRGFLSCCGQGPS
jgi:hypothetical protein